MTPIPVFFLHSMLVPFVQPLYFCRTYIRLEKHVFFTSSYIDFDIYLAYQFSELPSPATLPDLDLWDIVCIHPAPLP